MQLESLKMFCDVVETGSFSRAAQLNHVTQSAVSQQIRALEHRYEEKLLRRRARQGRARRLLPRGAADPRRPVGGEPADPGAGEPVRAEAAEPQRPPGHAD